MRAVAVGGMGDEGSGSGADLASALRQCMCTCACACIDSRRGDAGRQADGGG